MKIGIFDSGLGGLIILKDIIEKLPQYDYVYLGDNARTPYGNRSQEMIYKFTLQAVDFLFKKDCQLVILACNTASAEALRKIQQEWLPNNYPDRRVLGILRPLAEKAAFVSKNRVGVIGTKGTISSKAYITEIKKIKPKLEVIQRATPLLVPLIEEGWHKSDITKKVLRKYLQPLKLAKVDTLILGCTHYTFLLKMAKSIMAKKTKVLDSGEIEAEALADYLQRHPEIEEKLTKKQPVLFDKKKDLLLIKSLNSKNHIDWSAYKNLQLYVTDDSEHYQHLGKLWFGQGIEFTKIELT